RSLKTIYEEIIPSEDKDGECKARTSSCGRPRNKHSNYKEGHSKYQTHCRVIHCKGHSTLPNIVGPFFPRPNDSTCRDLYCASMLTLLHPWHELKDIKAGFNDFETAFASFLKSASQSDRDFLAGVQYYYDCKAAAVAHWQNDDEGPHLEAKNSHDADMEVTNSLDSDDKDDDMEVKLTEADLQAYEELQKNHHEELHALTAITAGRAKKIFGDEQCNWIVRSNDISIAQGVDYINLHNWQNQMMEDIADINDNDLSAICDTSIPAEVTMISSDEIISGLHNDHHGVKSLSLTMQSKVLEHVTAVDPSQLLKDQRCAYDIIDWHLTETLAGQAPPQLLMIIPGKGGVGKSKTI
ncbi:hypothetical protein BD769DRAFT_1696165, partial [Suillus cothurnatus]